MAKPIQHQIIARALELVSHEETWTRGALARNAEGQACPVQALEAVRFCAVGALSRAAFELLGEAPIFSLVEEVEHQLVAGSGLECLGLPTINDRDGREAIVALFQEALAA